MSRPAIFFDRDGIVNRSPGPGYVNRLSDFHILPGFIECVRVASTKGWPCVIVTNQRGISRGITPPAELHAMHHRLRDALAAQGLAILDILVCTANDNAHPDRKPNPGLLLRASKIYALDLSRSWMIGDRESDVQTGRNAGVAFNVLVDPRSTPTAATFRVPDMPACAALLQRML